MAQQGRAWLGKAWTVISGKVTAVIFPVTIVAMRLGWAWRGTAWSGGARAVISVKLITVGFAMAIVIMRSGAAGQGAAWPGAAGQGKGYIANCYSCG